ncbi:hypothetical protein SAMN02745111_01685 [Eubacterium uniforme]|uniref:DUF5050 domain-containing protein n=1 Tax=Eubacterium uniforme TaxID=39495 RepID=A0A1T4VVS7_9FIRM|nr:hypothetical protein [Eubacterium uniforme]SKA68928.1 hypothetical protein SAMN02745111_01685 [Eubacterium uniforme]
MKVEDLNKSKAYKKLNMSDVEKSELLEMCKSKKKELKSDIPDLSIRRTEKMKKDNISSVFKTVAVASLSIAATGAIIAGVANYNSGKDSNNISVAKRTTEVSSEIITKSTEDMNKDAEFETVVMDKEEIKEGKKKDASRFGVVFQDHVGDEPRMIFDYENKEMDCDGKIFKLSTEEGTIHTLMVKDKGEDKFTEIGVINSDAFSRIYTDGKKVIYEGEESVSDPTYVCIYDLETKHNEKIDVPKTSAKREDQNVNLFEIKGNYVYLNEEEHSYDNKENDWCDGVYNAYTYNLESGKVELFKEGRALVYISGEYLITEADVYKNSKFENTEYFIEKVTDNGIKEIKALGKDIFVDMGISNDKIMYFDKYNKMKSENGYTYADQSVLTLESFDMNTEEYSEVVTISVEDFNKDKEWSFGCNEITDEYAIFQVTRAFDDTEEIPEGYESYNEEEYKYTFATKKIEKVVRK